MYDGLMIEQRGKPAAVICTDQFISSARMTAQTFGMAGFPFARILHPIGRVSEKELAVRADVALPQVLAVLREGWHLHAHRVPLQRLESALNSVDHTGRQYF